MTHPDEQDLARLRAAFAVADAAPAAPSCPPAETLWAAVRGELPRRDLQDLLEHIAVCAACAEDWRLAAELERQTPVAATSPGKVIVGRFGPWRPLAAAAALAAALLIAVGVYRGNLGPQKPTYRDAESPATIQSLLAADQPLPRQGAVLRWSAVPGATAYDVRVSTEDLQPVATAEGLTATEYRIPQSALSALPPGAKLLWQVEAVFADGTRRPSTTFTQPLR